MISPVYTLIMMCAVGAGVYLSRKTQRTLPLAPGEKMGIGLGAFCGAMLGAKLPFVLSDCSAGRRGFRTARPFSSDWWAVILVSKWQNGRYR